jgi:hypothetical protein
MGSRLSRGWCGWGVVSMTWLPVDLICWVGVRVSVTDVVNVSRLLRVEVA